MSGEGDKKRKRHEDVADLEAELELEALVFGGISTAPGEDFDESMDYYDEEDTPMHQDGDTLIVNALDSSSDSEDVPTFHFLH